MLLDTQDLPDGHRLTASVCIVGAGAAGITMALEFLGSGIDVLLLEGGGLELEQDSQQLYVGSVVDERLHSPPDRYRQRRFGGSTTLWGGRCMPFDGIDFEAREYVAHSGWPIGLGELLPYYSKANRLCEAGEFAYDISQAFDAPLPAMIEGFESPNFTTTTLERFSCPTDFGGRYLHKLRSAANVTALMHANVGQINLDPSGRRVASLTVRNLQGKKFECVAQQIVLATGGLEVPRLLLSSRAVQLNGIGNEHDVVGRYYMCHLAGTIGRIAIDGPLQRVHHGYDVSDEGIYCRRRLALTAAAQRQQRLGNFVARMHHPRITDPAHRNAVLSLLFLAKFVIPYEYGKRLYGEESVGFATWLRHIRNVAVGPTDAFAFAWHMLRDRKLAERKFPSIIVHPKVNLFSLDFHAEQQPNPSSRITLTEERDALGMPRLKVDWRHTAADVDTVSRALALLAADFKRTGLGTFDYDSSQVEAEMIRYGAYGGHHVGTARMGVDPRSSVVDADCRIHHMDNLYIAGSAVFPTSSQANPTLTIVAMALRLAAHLLQQARRS